MNYAWYGKKSLFFGIGCWCGVLLYQNFNANDVLCSALIVLAVIVAGFARDTDLADGYWFRGNKK